VESSRTWGLTVLRVGLGAMMAAAHGWGKVVGGEERWTKLGGAMAHLGIDLAPTFWGAAAAFTELVGGLLLVVGLFTRPAAALLVFTMLVAAVSHYAGDPSLKAISHPVETGLGLLCVLIAGPGRYSLDARLRKKG
jgi:putative oxidoreductase